MKDSREYKYILNIYISTIQIVVAIISNKINESRKPKMNKMANIRKITFLICTYHGMFRQHEIRSKICVMRSTHYIHRFSTKPKIRHL